MPDAETPVYAEIDLTVSNSGDPIANANVVLNVYRDGELVEEFALGSNMNIPQGEIAINQRYIPADGFTSGDWTFSITIEAVTPQSNATTVVMEEPLTDTITVP